MAWLEPFRDGVGELSREGEVLGHLASVVTWFWSPFSPHRRQAWVWLVAVWADRTREGSIEDYPPWSYVLEMTQGFIECDEWSIERRGRYEFRWLRTDRAAELRAALAIEPRDF